MRRQKHLVSVGVIGLMSLGTTSMDTNPTASRATVTVNVNVTCSGGGVQTSVNPWVVRLQQGDDIDWVLNDQAQSSSIEITPKRPGQWAFGVARHQGARGRANAARARNMRPNQRGNRYQYNITLTCQDGETSYNVVIDPDVEIED